MKFFENYNNKWPHHEEIYLQKSSNKITHNCKNARLYFSCLISVVAQQ